jgi:flagellar hook assembly protein FlgD
MQKGRVSILNNVINPNKNQKASLHYILGKTGMVTITVFDLEGDIIDVLHRGRQRDGDHTTSWDGRNRGGRVVARGVYFIKIVAPDISEIRKVLVVK